MQKSLTLLLIVFISFLFLFGCTGQSYVIQNKQLNNYFDTNTIGSEGEVSFLNSDGNALETQSGFDFNKDTNTLSSNKIVTNNLNVDENVNIGNDLSVGNIINTSYINAGTTEASGTPTWYGTFGTYLNPTSGGGISSYILQAPSGAINNYAGYFDTTSYVHNSGYTGNLGASFNATTKITSGTNYQNTALNAIALFYPTSGSAKSARNYALSASAYTRNGGTADPETTSNIAAIYNSGFYPTATKGTIRNATGMQINIASGGTGTQVIDRGTSLLLNEPSGKGELEEFTGLELSNRYYTYEGLISGDYKGIYLEGLNGGVIEGSSIGIHLTEFGRGQDLNAQLVSDGGDFYINDGNIYLDGYIHADGYITNSVVADMSKSSALSQLDNINDWIDETGKIDYKEHYASKDYEVSKIVGYQKEPTGKMNCTYAKDKDGKQIYLPDGTLAEDCVVETILTDKPIIEKVTEHGLDLEVRVAEMEKMIYELNQKNKTLENQLCSKDLLCVVQNGLDAVVKHIVGIK